MTPNPATEPRRFLEHLFQVAVRRALPLHNTAAFLPPPPKGRTLVLGAGKAGGSMAQAVEALWPEGAPLQGLVVTRYGHIPPRPEGLKQRIEMVQASHPVPDAAGLKAAQRSLGLVQGLTRDDLVLCLISGGGSALLTLPAEGLTLQDKQRINRELLDCGANIAEMNCVRKHLSRIKGGRLAAACAPAPVVTLAISDVPGDDPSTIASGPTVPDASTCAEAVAILQRYRIDVPGADHEPAGARRPGDSQAGRPALRGPRGAPDRHAPAVAGSGGAGRARGGAGRPHPQRRSGRRVARSCQGARSVGAGGRAQGTALRQAVRDSVRGETTVTLQQRRDAERAGRGGRGGRAGEFCMGLAQALQGQPAVWALAADTDGIDGVEDNAGAFVAPDTLGRAAALGMQVNRYLDRNDAYGFFERLGDLVVTGPTHTNVNDFRAILVL